MKKHLLPMLLAAVLALAACSSQPAAEPADTNTDAAAAVEEQDGAQQAADEIPAADAGTETPAAPAGEQAPAEEDDGIHAALPVLFENETLRITGQMFTYDESKAFENVGVLGYVENLSADDIYLDMKFPAVNDRSADIRDTEGLLSAGEKVYYVSQLAMTGGSGYALSDTLRNAGISGTLESMEIEAAVQAPDSGAELFDTGTLRMETVVLPAEITFAEELLNDEYLTITATGFGVYADEDSDALMYMNLQVENKSGEDIRLDYPSDATLNGYEAFMDFTEGSFTLMVPAGQTIETVVEIDAPGNADHIVAETGAVQQVEMYLQLSGNELHEIGYDPGVLHLDLPGEGFVLRWTGYAILHT